jgi:HAD superfamily 5'-nucleotidase-like hydrolase
LQLPADLAPRVTVRTIAQPSVLIPNLESCKMQDISFCESVKSHTRRLTGAACRRLRNGWSRNHDPGAIIELSSSGRARYDLGIYEMTNHPGYETARGPVSAERHVYVNYTLDVTRVDAVGLDLDHTLAVYDDPVVNRLAFEETCRHLAGLRGYPARIGGLEYDHSVVARGLVADAGRGNLLKLDSEDRVCRALGKDGYLAREQIQETYGDTPFPGDVSYQIHSPFDLVAGALFVAMRREGLAAGTPEFHGVLADVVDMLDHTHRHGDLKRLIAADPGKYIRSHPEMKDMILRLREAGKRTFLLTNSGPDYTQDVLDYLFPRGNGGGGWWELFDAVVVDAEKPSFFHSRNERIWERIGGMGRKCAGVWRAGSARALEDHFGAAGARVMYIGDNPAADGFPARARGWRTALVVPEIDFDPVSVRPSGGDSPRETGGWGSVFWDSERPTRFLRIMRSAVDVVAARAELILGPGPSALFSRRSNMPF